MMTYVTEQFVKKIDAPIVCKFDGEELYFENGEELAAHQFEKRYVVDAIKIQDGKAVIALAELPVPNINYIGEEAVGY